MGKSTAVADLLVKNASRFDVVLCFIGSAACNPLLASIMARHFDNRFFFKAWNEPLVARLLEQQEELRAQGANRQALILVDDVVLTSAAEEQLCHLGMRGRHFNVSVITCSVSYTTLPKRFRRSLDVLMVFSCPMTGDMKVLTWEFAHRAKMAEFALRRLRDQAWWKYRRDIVAQAWPEYSSPARTSRMTRKPWTLTRRRPGPTKIK